MLFNLSLSTCLVFKKSLNSMGLLQQGSGVQGGLGMKHHAGASLQLGYGIGGLLSSLWRSALPLISKAAKSTVAAASKFGKSEIGQTLKEGLKESLVSAAAESASDLISGRSPRETLGTHLEDARGKIATAIKSAAAQRNKKSDSAGFGKKPTKRAKKPKKSKASKRLKRDEFDLLNDSE